MFLILNDKSHCTFSLVLLRTRGIRVIIDQLNLLEHL